MSDDFIVEEESSNRTFLYVAGGMAGLLLLGLIAIVVIALTRRGGDGNSEIAIMNQTIEAQNRYVTQTIEAMQSIDTTIANSPTPTLIKRAGETATAIPTFTPSPTLIKASTSVAQTPTPVITVESTAEVSGGEETNTPTAPTPTPEITQGQLPVSGLGMAEGIIIGAILIAVIVAVRWLRPSILKK